MEQHGATLRDGSRIAVIGGGPAGSLFAIFALRFAHKRGVDVDVTLFDGKPFGEVGPSGCNMCAGVIAASLVDKLENLGISLPDRVIQRGIRSYSLETTKGNLRLASPSPDDHIYTVYRGNGPRGSEKAENVSFDDYLLHLARENGAHVVHQSVRGVRLAARMSGLPGIMVGSADSETLETYYAELVVCAFGINSRLSKSIAALGFGYKPPDTVRTYQAELPCAREHIEAAFGDSIVIYDLNIPGIRFSAIIPKNEFLTATLVGNQADEERLRGFLLQPSVARRLPPGWELPQRYCHCRPVVSVSPARRPFTDRLVVIGEASHSRLYKNGLESAYVTAECAARTAVYRGVSRDAFTAGYLPACLAITRDSQFGRVIFWGINLRVMRMVNSALVFPAAAEEQAHPETTKRPTSAILWSIFTGDKPYRDILRRMLDPRWILGLLVRAIMRQVNGGH